MKTIYQCAAMLCATLLLAAQPTHAALFQHLDASVPGSVLSSGGSVTNWQDQSGNGNDATYVEGTVTDTGAGVLLGGTGGAGAGAAVMKIGDNVDAFSSGGYSLIIAYSENGDKPPAANNWNDLLTNTTIFGNTGKLMVRSANGGAGSGAPGRLQVASGAAAFSDSSSAPVAIFNDGDLSVVAIDHDAAGNFYMNTNRGLSASGMGNLPTGAVATGSDFLLGSGYSAGRWFNGTVHEIKIWDAAIGQQALDTEVAALHAKWAVPEPTSIALAGLLMAGVAGVRRRAR